MRRSSVYQSRYAPLLPFFLSLIFLTHYRDCSLFIICMSVVYFFSSILPSCSLIFRYIQLLLFFSILSHNTMLMRYNYRLQPKNTRGKAIHNNRYVILSIIMMWYFIRFQFQTETKTSSFREYGTKGYSETTDKKTHNNSKQTNKQTYSKTSINI